jgi:superfamily I DNA/RNA helicase
MLSIQDLKNFGKSIGVEIRGVIHDPWSLDNLTGLNQQPTMADRLLQLNHLGRHKGWMLKEMLREAPSDIDFHFAKWFTETYREWKKAEDRLDYTDLLTRYLKYGDPLDIEAILIDEGQDLSRLQWAVVHKLGIGAARRYIAGDDDQSIFTWAGASPEAFNGEAADEVRVLPQSYRIPGAVHDLSQSIVGRIRHRHPKEFLARTDPGHVLPVGFLSHEHLTDTSTFILFRNHYRGKALASRLEELGWPYSGTYSPFEAREVPDLISGYSKALVGTPVNPSEAKAMVLYATPAYLKKKAENIAAMENRNINIDELFVDYIKVHRFEQIFSKLRNSEYIGRTIRTAGIKAVLNPPITLMSIHQSKGREASTVILDLEMSRRTFESAMKHPDDEHRVFYVGVTRAKNRLLTLLPTDSTHYKL